MHVRPRRGRHRRDGLVLRELRRGHCSHLVRGLRRRDEHPSSLPRPRRCARERSRVRVQRAVSERMVLDLPRRRLRYVRAATGGRRGVQRRCRLRRAGNALHEGRHMRRSGRDFRRVRRCAALRLRSHVRRQERDDPRRVPARSDDRRRDVRPEEGEGSRLPDGARALLRTRRSLRRRSARRAASGVRSALRRRLRRSRRWRRGAGHLHRRTLPRRRSLCADELEHLHRTGR